MQHIDAFVSILDSARVLSSPQDLLEYGKDWTKAEPKALAVVFPKTTEEVSKIAAYCNDNQIAIVPSGGRTGLAGAANALAGELIISFEKMNQILSIDPINMSISAEAGVILSNLQEAAENADLFYPVDLAAKGSCLLGGNIATNAGGTKLIRFGGTREQVLGLEVVLANGEVLDLNFDLRKNNTGYDLKHLIVGSEGTLALITKATMKLVKAPKELQVAMVSSENLQQVTQLLGLLNKAHLSITAFEFLTDECMQLVRKHFTSARFPFGEHANVYSLIEFEKTGSDSQEQFEQIIAEAFEQELVVDAVIAGSSAEASNLWSLRENISESVSIEGHVSKNDIALPMSSLSDFVTGLGAILADLDNINMFLFGHIGDGNLHLNYSASKDIDYDDFKKSVRQVELKVFDLLSSFKGSISAEHGIGLLKKADLFKTLPTTAIDLMRSIKSVFDPKGILNPGKIFDI